jgi:hypothetical protein
VHPQASSSSNRNQSHLCILILIRPQSSHPCILNPHPTRINRAMQRSSSSDPNHRHRAPSSSSDQNHCTRASSSLIRHPTAIIAPLQRSSLIRPESSHPCSGHPHPTGIIAPLHPPHPHPTGFIASVHFQASSDQNRRTRASRNPHPTGINRTRASVILVRHPTGIIVTVHPHPTRIIGVILVRPKPIAPVYPQSSSDQNRRTRASSIFIRPESLHPCIRRPESSHPCILNPPPTRMITPMQRSASSDQNQSHHAS